MLIAMRLLRIAWLPLLASLVSATMVRDWYRDPWPPATPQQHPYGHNAEGSLVLGLTMVWIEVVVLLAVLRPWSYARSWGRALTATAMWLPWALYGTLLAMHAGGVIIVHTLWLWLALLVLVGMAIGSGIAAARSR